MEIYARVFSFIKKNCDNKIPKSSKLNSSDEKLIKNLKNNIEKLIKKINYQNLN